MRGVLELAQIVGFLMVVIPLGLAVAIAGFIAYLFVWLSVLGLVGIYRLAGLQPDLAATYREVVGDLRDCPPGNHYSYK